MIGSAAILFSEVLLLQQLPVKSMYAELNLVILIIPFTIAITFKVKEATKNKSLFIPLFFSISLSSVQFLLPAIL